MEKKIKILYDRINDYLKKYQSGIDTIDNFNGKFVQVQYELANYLFSIYAANERASELLDPLIVSDPVYSVAGYINKPENFMYYLSGSYLGKPIHKVSANQLEEYELIPQRRGSLAEKRINITSINNGWEAKPDSGFILTIKYIKQPPEAAIVFSLTTTADEDILVYEADYTVDFVWGQECINLLVFMMLEKVGVSVREELLREYAQMGLTKEAA